MASEIDLFRHFMKKAGFKVSTKYGGDGQIQKISMTDADGVVMAIEAEYDADYYGKHLTVEVMTPDVD